MTTKTDDIKLPPLPQSIVALDDCFPTTTSKVLTWGRSAVEADRQSLLPSDDITDAVSKAMYRAYSLGQTYWQQAYSDYVSQNKKSAATQRKFDDLVDDTRALLSRYGQPVASVEPSGLLAVAGQMYRALCEELAAYDPPIYHVKAAVDAYLAWKRAAPVAAEAQRDNEMVYMGLTAPAVPRWLLDAAQRIIAFSSPVAAPVAQGSDEAASNDFPYYELAFIQRVLEGDAPIKADLATACGMARQVRVSLLKSRVVAQEPDAKAVATAFRDRLISALASIEDCYLSRESIETAAEDVLHSFTAPVAAPVAQEPYRDIPENGYEFRKHATPVAQEPVVTDEMVTRFLGWHLPQDFAPDAGIAFNPSPDPHSWPVGTNLFTDPQARAMLEYVLTGVQK